MRRAGTPPTDAPALIETAVPSCCRYAVLHCGLGPINLPPDLGRNHLYPLQ
jgi:hypothetical protein